MNTKTIHPFVAQKQEFIVLHNALFDHVMPNVSPNAWKVLCFIVRKTKGWNKESDKLSFSQIREGTGIKSNHTLDKVIKELEGKYIIAHRSDEKWDATTYTLNLDCEIKIEDKNPSTPENEVEPEPLPSAKNAPDSSAKNAPDSSAKNAHTKEQTQKNNFKEQQHVVVEKISLISELGIDANPSPEWLKSPDITPGAIRAYIAYHKTQNSPPPPGWYVNRLRAGYPPPASNGGSSSTPTTLTAAQRAAYAEIERRYSNV